MLDVVIAGGGPAGLNAALMLGRAGRTVLLADDGQPRNSTSAAVHGFLSRDGASPAELRRIARGELDRYPSVQVRDTTITTATPATAGDGFQVTTADGSTAQAWRLLLATGVTDELPPVEGLARLWGRGPITARTATAGRPAARTSPCSATTTGPLTWRSALPAGLRRDPLRQRAYPRQ